VAQENKKLRLEKEQWLDRYLYIEIHEIFFFSFPIELYEWITKLADSQGRCKIDSPIVWTPELMQKLEASEDKITHTVDHWLDRVIGGFVTETWAFSPKTALGGSRSRQQALVKSTINGSSNKDVKGEKEEENVALASKLGTRGEEEEEEEGPIKGQVLQMW